MGAGRGELLTGVLAALPAEVSARVRPYAVERAARPTVSTRRVAGRIACRGRRAGGLLFANEWLDNVPVDVAEVDPDGVPHEVLVRPRTVPSSSAGRCSPGLTATGWPAGGRCRDGTGSPPNRGCGRRSGVPRDEAWAAAVGTLERGLAVAVDYGHLREDRPPFGTLTGFRDGREVAPVPDGSRDLTAHVALDACAAAGAAARERAEGPEPSPPSLLTQRAALHALHVDGSRPPLALASSDPAAYVRRLAAAGEAAELTDAAGLGAFSWLVQPLGGLTSPFG